MTILDDFYSPGVFTPNHKYDRSGVYFQLDATSDHEVRDKIYSIAIRNLP